MRQLIQPGRIIFGIGIAALGVLQFFAKDFIVARPPSPAWAADIPGKLAWAYISGILLILSGLAIVINKKAFAASIFTCVLIFISSFLLRNLPDMLSVVSAEDLLWKVNAYKTLAFCGGALIIAASFSTRKESHTAGFTKDEPLIVAGYIGLALFLIICGMAHFKFADFVKDLVPAYINNGYFWTYFAAIVLLAGGAGLIFKRTRKWAAALSGIMVLLWFVMLHIPRAVNIPPLTSVPIYGEWMGVFESFAFGGIFFVLAGLSTKEKPSAK
jgi:uncharacterized membrane protein